MAILSLIFKRAWQAQFLGHALVHKTKNVYLFKMYKWYYYHILIFLMVSDLEKSLKSFLSRVQSSLPYTTETEVLMQKRYKRYFVWCQVMRTPSGIKWYGKYLALNRVKPLLGFCHSWWMKEDRFTSCHTNLILAFKRKPQPLYLFLWGSLVE